MFIHIIIEKIAVIGYSSNSHNYDFPFYLFDSHCFFSIETQHFIINLSIYSKNIGGSDSLIFNSTKIELAG